MISCRRSGLAVLLECLVVVQRFSSVVSKHSRFLKAPSSDVVYGSLIPLASTMSLAVHLNKTQFTCIAPLEASTVPPNPGNKCKGSANSQIQGCRETL